MTRSDERFDPSVVVRAAVEVLVFAPLGLGARLLEDTPAAVGEARRELSNARFIGRLTVDQGIKQLRTSLEPDAPSTPRSTNRQDAPDDLEQPAAAGDVDRSDDPVATDLAAGDLALPDYDTLPAIDIVGKLETLDHTDREAIERYESANRQRRTVLGKLAQLADR
jgi:hypothetical protein